jgi:hypothetical protein
MFCDDEFVFLMNQDEVCAVDVPSSSRTANRNASYSRRNSRALDDARNRIKELEQELAEKQAELDLINSRPSIATQRENYVMEEVESVNRQLEGY